jgi:hypothetical protein
MKNFTEYLQNEHGKDYHGTDDDMPDAFDNWLTDLQVDDLINYGNMYGNLRFIEGLNKAEEVALRVFNKI